jgi:tetratricopeptide (TPR) repeat protein
MIACWGLGVAWLRNGRHAEATVELERNVGICRDLALPVYLHNWLGPALGSAYLAAGRPAEAIVSLEEAVNQATARMMVCHRAPALATPSEAYLLTGDIGKALQVAEQARALAREKRQRGYEAGTTRVLAEIASRAEPLDVEKAGAHYHEALSAAVELGMRPLVAHCHLGLGKLYQRSGNRQEAQEHLATAMTMYREMGMTYWLEQAEAQVN